MIEEIKITQCTCERCNYKWIPRLETQQIILCPKCKSPYWNKPKKKKQSSSTHT